MRLARARGLPPVRNLVFMGMGEPLDNLDAVQHRVRGRGRGNLVAVQHRVRGRGRGNLVAVERSRPCTLTLALALALTLTLALALTLTLTRWSAPSMRSRTSAPSVCRRAT